MAILLPTSSGFPPFFVVKGIKYQVTRWGT